MMGLARLRREESGFTLVEVMVASLVLVVGVFGSVTLIDGANTATVSTQAREGANNLAREVIEDARSIPYEEITPTLVGPRLRAKPGLDTDPSSETWRVERRGFTYTVTVDACSVDDADDGAGDHPEGISFCAGSAAAGGPDSDPEDYKRVIVDVSWTRGSGSRRLRQSGIVPNPGNAAGVGIATLAGPETVTSASASFDVTTTRAATLVEWTVDGSARGTATGSGTSWSFAWPIDLCDGAHVVGVQAYDGFGRSAGSRSLTVTLARGVACPDAPGPGSEPPPGNKPPTAPIDLTLKATGKSAKLSWGAASDPDAGDRVAAYRVYRDGVLYATTSSLSYTDGSLGRERHTYWVTAVDTGDAESERSNSVDYLPPGYTP
ncbi:MAG: prepilin-type N-terminal cleavage/methylation domain-containing protein [Actinomycetota bacterium]|nr:prepilin-type N-terminal cleavage/methylation domain-containing protein [Actinomycetota bacterium]